MCQTEAVHSGDHNSIGFVLDYLSDHMNDCDSYIYGVAPYDVIRWIDIGIEMCLFPLELHDGDWEKNLSLIEVLLNRSEELVKRIAPSDYKEGHRTSSVSGKENAVELAQKLNVYFSVLHMYSEEWEKLRERLGQVLADTEQNVRYMLSCADMSPCAYQDDWAFYHYMGTDAWETLNWFSREFLPNGNGRKIYIETYEKYVLFLNGLRVCKCNSEAHDHLRLNAEKRLRDICEHILYDLGDLAEDNNKDANDENEGFPNAEEEIYECIIKRSEERSYGVIIQKEEEALQERTLSSEMGGSGIPERSYHTGWRRFTKKLRRLMKKNPSLPVVLLDYSMHNDKFECDVGYAYI